MKEPISKSDKIIGWVFIPLFALTFLGYILKGCGYWKGF